MFEYRVYDNSFTYYGSVWAGTDEQAIQRAKFEFQIYAPIVENVEKLERQYKNALWDF